MKDLSNKIKKPFYKKWWFWLIIAILVIGFIGGQTSDTSEPAADTSFSSSETHTESTSSDKFIDDVKDAVRGSVGENESITDVTLKNGDLCISVDLSKADPSPLTMEDLALSRVSSITDAFLDLTDYDDQWDTITVDFGDIGKVVNKKSDVKENEYGMRYFAEENFKLE